MSVIPSTYIENTFSEGKFTFQSVSRNEKKDTSSISLLEWMGQNGNILLEGPVESSIDPKKEVKEIHFRLSGNLGVFYSLLRGITGSGQPASMSLHAHHEARNFTLQYEDSAEEEAKNYLAKVLKIIEDEARFKQVLSKVIANQEKFKLEEKLLFNELS